LDPENHLAHLIKGQSHLWYEWDFGAADEEYQFLKQRYPNSFNLPALLLSTGRFEEALEDSQRNLKTDPLDPIGNSYYIWSLYFNGKKDQVFAAIQNGLTICKGRQGHLCLFLYDRIAEMYQFLGMYQQSQEICKKYFGDDIFAKHLRAKRLSIQAVNQFHMGSLEETISLLERIKLMPEESLNNNPSFHIAMIYAQMEKTSLAFRWLEKSYQNQESEMYWLKVYPSFEPLYSDPRWQQMLDKVGFPK